MDADAQTLAEAVLLTADVSHLRALMQVRAEMIAAGHTPSADVPTEQRPGHRDKRRCSTTRLRPAKDS